jgi:hypothetical protein
MGLISRSIGALAIMKSLVCPQLGTTPDTILLSNKVHPGSGSANL